MKKILILCFVMLLSASVASAAWEEVKSEEGYNSHNGWVTANMTIGEGKISMDTAYSINFFKDFGLIPVAYCESGGTHLGVHYVFYVNPYHDCLIIGRMGGASYGHVFENLGPAVEDTGKIIYYYDVWPHQDIYRKAIRVAKAAFAEYQAAKAKTQG